MNNLIWNNLGSHDFFFLFVDIKSCFDFSVESPNSESVFISCSVVNITLDDGTLGTLVLHASLEG